MVIIPEDMETRTFLLWFQLDKAQLKDNTNDVCSKVKSLPGLFTQGPWTTILQRELEDGSTIFTFIHNNGSHALVRLYSSGLMTFDLQSQEADSAANNNRPLLQPMIRAGLSRMTKHLGSLCIKAKCMDCPIFRSARAPWVYSVTGDERLLQRDFTELVYETDSPWQNIKIYKSAQCGNVLYLDDDVMLGESDLVYSESLLRLEKNDFTDRSVLIMGGGDGGLLHELITRSTPAFVTMVEIDEDVIKACRTHMRSVCGDVMDQYEGDNYKIIIEDCDHFLTKAIEDNRQFDFVINDLTEYPVDRNKRGYEYDYEASCHTLQKSLKVLAPTGKYLARGNTVSVTDYGSKLELHLKRMGLEYSVISTYVPSFQEVYCFVEAWRPVQTS